MPGHLSGLLRARFVAAGPEWHDRSLSASLRTGVRLIVLTLALATDKTTSAPGQRAHGTRRGCGAEDVAKLMHVRMRGQPRRPDGPSLNITPGCSAVGTHLRDETVRRAASSGHCPGDLPAMAHPHDQDDELPVYDFVDDPIVADTEPVAVFIPG